MNKLFFWHTWPGSFKKVGWAGMALLLITLLGMAIAAGQFPEGVFQPIFLQEVHTRPVLTSHIAVSLFSLPVTADNHIIFEHIRGGAPDFSAIPYYFLLMATMFAAIVLYSIATTLSRFRFFIGAGIFIAFLALLRPDALGIWGITNKVPLIVLSALYVMSGFYFNAFNKGVSFAWRFLFFFLLTGLTGIVVWTGSTIQHPLLLISAYATAPAFIVCFLVLLFSAHEVIVFFVKIISEGSQRNSLLHVLVLTFAYLSYLLIAYLQHVGYLSWGIWTPNMVMLATCSVVLGIWGYRSREPQYEHIYPANPFGTLLYMCLLLVFGATIACLYGTSNDPGIDLFQNLSLYTHIGVGLIFLLYIISNFSPLLKANVPIHKVLYKPDTMPYFTFRLASIIATYAFLAYDVSWYQVMNQSVGSYYNAVGGAYYYQGDNNTALAYYQYAARYRHLNHQAHYTLASLYATQLAPTKEQAELLKATDANATPQTYLNLSETYRRLSQPDHALEVLQQGLLAFPNNGALFNAMGLLYSKTLDHDSAMYYFGRARNTAYQETAMTNLLGFSATLQSSFPADSLYKWTGSTEPGARSNALALANQQGTTLPFVPEDPQDTILTAHTTSVYGNYFIRAADVDTTVINHVVTIARKPGNEFFADYLLLAAAHAYYNQGLVNKAFTLVRQVAFRTGKARHNHLLGLWSLDKNNPLMAAGYFEKANKEPTAENTFALAIAWAEADSLHKALPLWRQLVGNEDYDSIAKSLVGVLGEERAGRYTEQESFLHLRYHVPLYDTITFWRIWTGLEDEDNKARALVDQTERWLALDEVAKATFTFQHTLGLTVTSPDLYERIKGLNVRLVAANNNWEQLAMSIEAWGGGRRQVEKLYYEALLDVHTGQNTAATDKYRRLLRCDHHLEDAVVQAVAFLMKEPAYKEEAYAALVDAIHSRPQSVKLRKAYVLTAIELEFLDEAETALARLRTRLPPHLFDQFIRNYPEQFSVL